MILAMVVNVLDRVVGERVGQIVVLLWRFEGRIIARQPSGSEVVRAAGDQPVVAVEAASQGPGFVRLLLVFGSRQMPFADHVRAVAGAAEDLRDRDATTVELTFIARLLRVLDHVPNARLMGVQAGQQRGP